MLSFVSDLHLADTASRCTVDVPHLIKQLRLLANNAAERKIEALKIVLLGDIFEVLKSTQWLSNEVRPWEVSTPAHVSTVAAIFESIVATNGHFFSGLQSICEEFPFVSLHYVPGNHDLPLNTEMGAEARRRLQTLLPLQHSSGEPFRDYFFDGPHGVIARHGHEWDQENRYTEGRAAIGDAIVIDLLLRLPIIVAEKLRISADDERLGFLHELDNVRPQAPQVMAKWVLRGLGGMTGGGEGARKAINEAFIEVATGLQAAIATTRFESIEVAEWWISFLIRLAPIILKHLDVLSAALHLTDGGVGGPGPYREFAVNDFQISDTAGGEFRYVICGHTHEPQLIPVDLVTAGDKRARLYLNTGTWRRVHRYASVASGADGDAAFARWDEECVISIYNPDDQANGFPAYEFARLTRGAQL